jgi:hypothetical protein
LGVPLSPGQAVAPLVPPTPHFVKLFAAETGAEHRSQADEPSPMRVARLRQPPLIGRPDSPKAQRQDALVLQPVSKCPPVADERFVRDVDVALAPVQDVQKRVGRGEGADDLLDLCIGGRPIVVRDARASP